MKYAVPIIAVTLGVAGSALGCGGGDAGRVEMVDPAVCESGLRWIGGDNGSEHMHPGQDCISCHERMGGPHFTLAGTVYGSMNQADDCYGIEGVTVTITDQAGSFTMTTNEAGNFHTDRSIMFPYTAMISDGMGGENQMITMQAIGTCGACHTQTGLIGAPGRIFIP